MKTEFIRLLCVLPCSAETAFTAWLDSQQHAAILNDTADIDPVHGGYFTIMNDTITGRTLQIDERIRRITQQWHFAVDEWPEEEPSRVMITFAPINDHECELQLEHSGVPIKHAEMINKLWQERYFPNMQRYFAVRPDVSSSQTV